MVSSKEGMLQFDESWTKLTAAIVYQQQLTANPFTLNQSHVIVKYQNPYRKFRLIFHIINQISMYICRLYSNLKEGNFGM